MRERPYEKLIAWKEAHILCVLVYSLTKKLPSDEKFRLVSQMRRSSYSIPTDIAEGNTRRSSKDKAYFFERAISSLEELHYQLKLCHTLEYFSERELIEMDDHIQRTGFLLMKLRASIIMPSSDSSVSSSSSVSSDSSDSSDSSL